MLSRLLPLLLLSGLLAGCASPVGRITFLSVDGRQNLTQNFGHAYISQDSRGEYDVLLVDEGPIPRPKKPGQALDPVHAPPLRQVMHVHLYWRPQPGTPQNNPAAINASIEWYVLGPTTEGENNLVYYSGAGLVSVESGGRGRRVSVRDGQLRPTTRRGTLGDPIGPSVLTGSANAVYDDLRVRNLLAEIKQVQ